MLAGVATHAVDEFVVLHQTDVVEAADAYGRELDDVGDARVDR